MTFKEILGECGMTQSELAGQLKCSQQTVSAWCTGKNCPDIETVVNIASILSCSTEKIVQSIIESKIKNSPEGELKD